MGDERSEYDQSLYDAVMAEAPDNPYERDLWAEAVDMAARISAERRPVSDEDLASIFADAIEASHTRNPARPDGQHIISGLRAVRAAITPPIRAQDDEPDDRKIYIAPGATARKDKDRE